MASGFNLNQKNNHFEAIYEHPWGGVASDAYKTDIAPNEMEICDNLIIKNGTLNTAVFDDLGYDLSTVLDNITLIFYIASLNQIYLLDASGNIYTLNYVAKTVTLAVTNALCTDAISCSIINNQVYVFSRTQGASFLFNPVAVTFTLNSNFVGGFYSMVLDQYLITANTNQPTDTPAIKPNRINWSSPDGFSIWNPSVDRSSGFNTLADVSDQITGLFASGNVGYILRGQGLTQMTPTGVGIQPFDFTPIWTSLIGLGCLFPTTLAVYGNIVIWGNDSGFYFFQSGGAPVDICQQAKDAIFSDIIPIPTGVLVNFQNLSACIYNSSTVGTGTPVITPDLRYTLSITQLSSDRKTITVIFWTYSFKTKSWTRQKVQFTNGGNTFADLSGVLTTVYYPQPTAVGMSSNNNQIPMFALCALSNGVRYNKILSLYTATLKYEAGAPNPIGINVAFRAEQIKAGRKPNIRGVLVIAKGKAAGPQTLKIDIKNEINTVHFTDITVTDNIVRTYISNGMFTSENPQLVISSTNFDGSIIKAIAYGTYAEGELP